MVLLHKQYIFIVRALFADNKTLKPIPSIRHVTWQQIHNASTPTVYIDVMLFRELAISPWAKVQFSSQSTNQSKIDTALNGTHMMHRFVFDHLDTPPKTYDVTTTIYLLANNARCAVVNIGYVEKSEVKTILQKSSNGQQTSALFSSTVMLFIFVLYIDLFV